ncbi:MAG: hypothetical protein AAGD14_01870, partial [Planctomycetota bacterium]
SELASNPDTAALKLSTGVANARNVHSLHTESGEPIPHVPIGIGTPLTIEIRHVYTGRFPRAWAWDSDKDMLVVSAMRGLETYTAAPRAVNYLKRDVTKRSHHRAASATEQGTPLVFYSPALTGLNSVIDLEIVFDEFPSELFGAIGGATSAAAGVPVFIPASGYLLAAGEILKLLGRAGEALFDGTPVFKETHSLSFDRPGDSKATADFRLVMRDQDEAALEGKYHVDGTGRLVRKGDGKPYDGDSPYMVLSLDGRERPDFSSFSPTAASAAILERFYGKGAGLSAGMEVLTDAMQLYNDWVFRGKAERIALKLEGMSPGDPGYDDLRKELDASLKNIQNSALSPEISTD